MIGLPKEPISPSNLKIRIPTPKVDNYVKEDKSKEKKYNIFIYIMNCINCCYFDDDYYY